MWAKSRPTIQCKFCKKDFARINIRFMDFCPDCLNENKACLCQKLLILNKLVVFSTSHRKL